MPMDERSVFSTIDSFIEEHYYDDDNYGYMDGSETVKLFDDFALVFNSSEQLIYVVMRDGDVLHDLPQSTDNTLRNFLYLNRLNWKGEPMGERLEL